jgi:putative transposase
MTNKGRDISPKPPIGRDGIGRDDMGRDGSPSRPKLGQSPLPESQRGRDHSPNDPTSQGGAFGERALPNSVLSGYATSGALGESALPKRKILSHDVPSWVPDGATFFITVNCVPRGQNQLAIPAAADALMESLIVRIEKGQWWPRLVLFMPDHLHALIAFSPDHPMEKIIRDWKRYTARSAGIHWQRNFFDHRIRNEESLAEKWNYILQNPVRAALAPTPESWPYVWINEDDRDGKGRDEIGRDGSPSRPSANVGLKNVHHGRARSPNGPPESSKIRLNSAKGIGFGAQDGAFGEHALPKKYEP